MLYYNQEKEKVKMANIPFELLKSIVIKSMFGQELHEHTEETRYDERIIAREIKQELGYSYDALRRSKGISTLTFMPYFDNIMALKPTFSMLNHIAHKANDMLEGHSLTVGVDGLWAYEDQLNVAVFYTLENVPKVSPNGILYYMVNGFYRDDEGSLQELYFCNAEEITDETIDFVVDLAQVDAQPLDKWQIETFKTVFQCCPNQYQI